MGQPKTPSLTALRRLEAMLQRNPFSTLFLAAILVDEI